jgi:hypothetical protein
MKATLLSGLAAVALAGYGVYEYTRPAAATPAAAVAEDLAKDPPNDAKEPGDLAKEPPQDAKEPGDLGTILD